VTHVSFSAITTCPLALLIHNIAGIRWRVSLN
jgi:hypothetical protein